MARTSDLLSQPLPSGQEGSWFNKSGFPSLLGVQAPGQEKGSGGCFGRNLTKKNYSIQGGQNSQLQPLEVGVHINPLLLQTLQSSALHALIPSPEGSKGINFHDELMGLFPGFAFAPRSWKVESEGFLPVDAGLGLA